MGRKSREKRDRREASLTARPPEPRSVSSVTLEETRLWADELLAWCDEERDLTMALPTPRSYMALANYTRSFALFRSLLALLDADERAAIGMVTRGLYEDWLTMALLIKGTDDDWFKLLADSDAREREVNDAFGTTPQRPPLDLGGHPVKKWSVRQRAKRVDELLPDSNAAHTYQTLYALESMASNHSGLSASGLHLGWDEQTQTPYVNHEPFADDVTVPRLIYAGIFVTYSAALMFEAGGYDISALAEIAGRYSDDRIQR